MEIFGTEEKTRIKYAHSSLNSWLFWIASMFPQFEKYIACINLNVGIIQFLLLPSLLKRRNM